VVVGRGESGGDSQRLIKSQHILFIWLEPYEFLVAMSEYSGYRHLDNVLKFRRTRGAEMSKIIVNYYQIFVLNVLHVRKINLNMQMIMLFFTAG
jgi:hypothetical protein